MVKLDLGTGKAGSPEEWIEVDIKKYSAKTKVVDLRKAWPWKNGSVEEVFSRNLINYFTPVQRIHFANELYRVMKRDARAIVVVPHWCSNRAYGDLSVQWPPVAEEWLPRLNKKLREENFYWEKGYKCNFDITSSYGMHPEVTPKAVDYQHFAITFYKEAAQELIITLIKR